MDIVTYAILRKQIANINLAYSYKGSVSSVGNLPSGAAAGDLYTVQGDQYVWDGTAWVRLEGNTITNAQIDALFS